MIRSDVNRLAIELDSLSNLDKDVIYHFLMKGGQALNINPCRLQWGACDGKVWLASNPDSFCLLDEVRHNKGDNRVYNYDIGLYVNVDYESLITYDLIDE